MTDDELRRIFETTPSDMRRHFDITAERLEKRIDLVGEAVVRVDQKLDRTAADIGDEMRRGFSDTQAMIKFSHASPICRHAWTDWSHRHTDANQARFRACSRIRA